MGAFKYDYPPLLAPGRHYLTLPDVERLCVLPFDGRAARERLYYAFEELVQRFLRESIPCEMCIDGSFLTRKPDPGDVDVAIKLAPDVADNLTQSQRELVDDANSDDYINGVQSFVYVEYPVGHPLYGLDEDDDSWCAFYCREHAGFWLKGVAILRLGETHVGLRICR